MSLLPDPALGGLDVAWSEARMVQFFNRRAAPALGLHSAVTRVRLERATYSPGKECFVVYALTLAGQPEKPVTCVVTFAAVKRLQRECQPAIEGGDAVLLPEDACLVELFPHDCRLPGLASALEPPAAGQALRRTGLGIQATPVVEVLAYYAHRRAILLYHWPAANGGLSRALGKVYAPGPLAARVRDTLDCARGHGAERGLSTPRTLAVLGDQVVMDWLPGQPLDALLESALPPDDKRSAVRQAAVALAALHDFPVSGQGRRTLARDWERHGRRAQLAGLVAPALAQRADSLRDAIRRRLPGAAEPADVFLHGDYKTSQILVDDAHLSIVDFDRAARGDPAIDVGNFMADLHRQAAAGGGDPLRDLAGEFLDAYGHAAGRPCMEASVRLMMCLALVRMALRAFRHAPHLNAGAEAASPAGQLLDEAARCLGQKRIEPAAVLSQTR